MRLRVSMFVDAFLGSGVPLSGDPITSVQNVLVLGLRTTTVLSNCKPMVQDIVKVCLIATNCGEEPIEIRQPVGEHPEENVIALLPGEFAEYSVFRSWESQGEYQLALVYEARCAGRPFARLSYPSVTLHVKSQEASNPWHWILHSRAALWRNKSLQATAATPVN